MTDAADLIVRGRIGTLGGDAGFGWAEAIAETMTRFFFSGSRRNGFCLLNSLAITRLLVPALHRASGGAPPPAGHDS